LRIGGARAERTVPLKSDDINIGRDSKRRVVYKTDDVRQERTQARDKIIVRGATDFTWGQA